MKFCLDSFAVGALNHHPHVGAAAAKAAHPTAAAAGAAAAAVPPALSWRSFRYSMMIIKNDYYSTFVRRLQVLPNKTGISSFVPFMPGTSFTTTTTLCLTDVKLDRFKEE